MLPKTLLAAAALVLVSVPSSPAHADDYSAGTSAQEEQRQIERSRYETERSEVRNRLNSADSVAERGYDSNSRLNEPSSLNDTAPASGIARDNSTQMPPAGPTRSSYNE